MVNEYTLLSLYLFPSSKLLQFPYSRSREKDDQGPTNEPDGISSRISQRFARLRLLFFARGNFVTRLLPVNT